jgi:hypothetical protein
MNLICDNGALGGWFYDAVMFQGSEGVSDDMLGLTGYLRETDDSDGTVITDSLQNVDVSDEKIKFFFCNIGNRIFISYFI